MKILPFHIIKSKVYTYRYVRRIKLIPKQNTNNQFCFILIGITNRRLKFALNLIFEQTKFYIIIICVCVGRYVEYRWMCGGTNKRQEKRL